MKNENILEKFLLELNDGKIRYKTFSQFLNEYDGALLYIQSNYVMILSNIYIHDYILLIDLMYKDNHLKNIVESHFLETVQCCPNPAFLHVILNIYLEGKDDEQKREFLKPYFTFLVEYYPISFLTQLLEYKYLDPSFYDLLNKKITLNKHEYIKGNLLNKDIQGIDVNNSDEFDAFISAIILVIDELLEEENKKNNTIHYADISFDEGQYSLVLLIGDKVLSIGDRENYVLPNHRRILQPLIRPNISRLTQSKPSIYTTMIDVSERVDMESEISEEELYLVYKELRDDNILWTDVKRENVGRLLKPNVVHFSKTLADFSTVKGFSKELDSDTEVLGVGEVVVVDKDFIYNLNYYDFDDIEWFSDLAYEFDKRYEEEKNMGVGRKTA